VTQGACFLALVTDAFGGYGGIAQYNRDFLNGYRVPAGEVFQSQVSMALERLVQPA
jgi:hypothetical protein